MPREGAWPVAETALDIHGRLCQDDPIAPSELALAFLDLLAAWLRRRNPGVDPHLCEEAAADAIIALIKNPRSFDPVRGSLDAYLRMSAQGDLRNALEKERRRRKHLAPLEVVEHSGPAGNSLQDESDPARIVEREAEDREALMHTLSPEIERAFTREERAVYELIRQGERQSAAFASALGIAHLPELEQRREVKRFKDRIKRRFQRARGRP